VAIASAPSPVRTFERAIGLRALPRELLLIADPMRPPQVLGFIPKTPAVSF
jgi:hypothetical protein